MGAVAAEANECRCVSDDGSDGDSNDGDTCGDETNAMDLAAVVAA